MPLRRLRDSCDSSARRALDRGGGRNSISEIPAKKLEVAPIQIRTFVTGVITSVSDDGKIFILQGQTLDGGTCQLEFPLDAVDTLVKTIRDTQAAARGGLVVADTVPNGKPPTP